MYGCATITGIRNKATGDAQGIPRAVGEIEFWYIGFAAQQCQRGCTGKKGVATKHGIPRVFADHVL